MAGRAQQHSATSLARYATAKAPDVDLWNGSTSREFCNSFWGTSDSGPNIMFARMRGASKTTDELRNFWNERCIIEEEYAARLAKLAKAPIGGDEIGELRTALDTLRIETEKQAQSHLELANQIRHDLEDRTAAFHQRQITHRRTVQAPLERKFKERQNRESYVKKSREKYEADVNRIKGYTQQLHSYSSGPEASKIQQKLQRTQQTLQANERDFAKFTQELQELLPSWEKEWKEYSDSCQDLEEERIEFMKDIMWTYANDVSTICVADDLSCERVRTALDQVEPERDVENFVQEYGTGNTIVRPANFAESNGMSEPQLPGSPLLNYANYQRISKRVIENGGEGSIITEPIEPQVIVASPDPTPAPPPVAVAAPAPAPVSTPAPSAVHHNHTNGSNDGHHHSPQNYDSNGYNSRSQVSLPQSSPPRHPPPPIPESGSYAPSSSAAAVAATNPGTGSSSARINRVSGPLPVVPNSGGGFSRGFDRPQTPPPPVPQHSRILFYVKALYDYTATIEEEFDFQAGDIIAVTATPDDGWWSGELLDEARRREGRNVFPSNFVCLF